MTISQLIGPNNDYSKIVIGIIVYLLSLWVLFCFWVFLDSLKRFKNFFISIIFFFLVLIINIPALVFYLIIRPEKDDENVLYLHNESLGEGGVNVPIVNFIGKDGNVALSFQLKLNNMPNINEDRNMNVTVDWNSGDNDRDKFIVEKPLKNNSNIEIPTKDYNKVTPKENKPNRISGFFSNKVNTIVKKVRRDKTPELSNQSLVEKSQIVDISQNNDKKSEDAKNDETNFVDEKPLNEA